MVFAPNYEVERDGMLRNNVGPSRYVGWHCEEPWEAGGKTGNGQGQWGQQLAAGMSAASLDGLRTVYVKTICPRLSTCEIC